MNTLYAAVLAYITTISAIIVLKPNYFYTHSGELKEFGCRANQCMAPYYTASLFVGIIVYFVSMLINK